jgi:hypothetical protein
MKQCTVNFHQSQITILVSLLDISMFADILSPREVRLDSRFCGVDNTEMIALC